MSKKQTIIRGTFILTLTGFLSRFMGFFYRVFLSHTFGEEGVGLYQLIFPVYALCFSLTSAGIETAISRTVARKMSLGREREAKDFLFAGLFLSVSLSILSMLVVQHFSAYIAEALLGDVRCEPLLIAMTYALPFASVHSCICGYYYGLKQTKVPALSQLAEQTVRIVSVYLFYLAAEKSSSQASITVAVFGLVLGEIASTAYCIYALTGSHQRMARIKYHISSLVPQLKELLPLSTPLTANRVLINLLQSIEAVSIPSRLQLYSHSVSDSLSIYGVLTGMALPCILFPSAITGSVAIMLMPTVAEIQTTNNRREMTSLIKKVTQCCFILGLGCCFAFLLLGSWIGTVLFDSVSAGKFIVTLAWICPFLYTNTTLLSVINGLGKTTSTFFINAIGLLIRICSVFFAIPAFGIQGYLWGLLGSQLVVSLLCFARLYSALKPSAKHNVHCP